MLYCDWSSDVCSSDLYDLKGYERSNLVKLDILINREEVEDRKSVV